MATWSAPADVRELHPSLNHLQHVRELFDKYGALDGRSQRAERLGVRVHLVNRVFRRGDKTYQGMPDKDVMSELARFIGCPYDELYVAFGLDLHPEVNDFIPRINAFIALLVQMSTKQQETVLSLAKSVHSATPEQQKEILAFAKKVASGM